MSVELPPGIVILVITLLLLVLLLGNLLVRIFAKISPRITKQLRRYRFRFVVASLITIILLLIIAPIVLQPIQPGETGVLWRRFAGGTQTEMHFDEGTVLVYPWDKLYVYHSRFQTSKIKVLSVTSEGLKVTLDIVVRFRPVIRNIPKLHKFVGEEYISRLIIPEVGSSARLIISKYTAEEVYSKERELIQTSIFNEVNASLSLNEQQLTREQEDIPELSKFIYLEDILIRDVELPEKVNIAIINKVNQNYLFDEYITRIKVAEKEAARKQTEAKGIANFQATVSGGISENYLRWRGIEATIDLAKSDNSKVVVIGSGRDGLPLILNTENDLQSPKTDNPGSEKLNQIGAENPEAIEISIGEYPEK
jgi:regulator of protease activity HflC (stomatin/prohibitin superfamily)